MVMAAPGKASGAPSGAPSKDVTKETRANGEGTFVEHPHDDEPRLVRSCELPVQRVPRDAHHLAIVAVEGLVHREARGSRHAPFVRPLPCGQLHLQHLEEPRLSAARDPSLGHGKRRAASRRNSWAALGFAWASGAAPTWSGFHDKLWRWMPLGMAIFLDK